MFHNGDILRFRLTSKIYRYLYVLDKGTTGTTAMLFPASSETAANNRVEVRHTYLVPASGEGWFEVSGPAEFDILYFLVSATPISLPSGSSAKPGTQEPAPPPPNLLLRCDDDIFKARGECVDARQPALLSWPLTRRFHANWFRLPVRHRGILC